jgi:hypothetical protein
LQGIQIYEASHFAVSPAFYYFSLFGPNILLSTLFSVALILFGI